MTLFAVSLVLAFAVLAAMWMGLERTNRTVVISARPPEQLVTRIAAYCKQDPSNVRRLERIAALSQEIAYWVSVGSPDAAEPERRERSTLIAGLLWDVDPEYAASLAQAGRAAARRRTG